MNIRLIATSVMGIHHTHPKGEWMIGYADSGTRMGGNRIGTKRTSDQKILENFKVTPTSMDMKMQMLGFMYAPARDFTVMAMVPFMRMSMDHVTRAGVRFTTESAGLGDIPISGLYTFYNRENARLHLEFGVSLPSGSIDQRDDTPAGPDRKLPYPMQLGSGTFDLKPGITYLSWTRGWSWGAHMDGTFRPGKNGNNYRLGNRYVLDGWLTRRWNDWISTSVRTVTNIEGRIDGSDPDLNPTLVPTADPNLRGGKRIDLHLGFNVYVPTGTLSRNRFSVEIGIPTYQSLNGPQLETDWVLSFGWQYAWTFGNE